MKRKINHNFILKITSLIGLYLVFTLSIYLLTGYFFAPKSPPTPTEPKLLIEVNNETDWIRGNKEAAITLVEYCDFQEPTCAEFYPLLKEIIEQKGEEVRFVYRHYPVKDTHPQADLAARMSEAAGKQGKFWEMHDLLYDKKTDWEDNKEAKEEMLELAQTLKIDLNALETDLDSDEIKKNVDGDLYGALASGVQNTATFFLNGALIQLPKTSDEIKAILTPQ